MATQFNIRRMNFFREAIENFFCVQFQSYLNADLKPTAISLRTQNELSIDDAFSVNPNLERILFFSINSYGRQKETVNRDGTLGTSVIYSNASLSLFFLGINEDMRKAEDLSYSLVQELMTFSKEKGGVVSLEDLNFKSNITITIPDSLVIGGLEKGTGIVKSAYFTTYFPNFEININIIPK